MAATPGLRAAHWLRVQPLTFSGLEPQGQAPGWDSLGPSSAYSCFPLQDGRQRPEAREGFGYPSPACVPASPVPFFILKKK